MSRTVLLAYHAVTKDWVDDLAVTPATFRRQLETLKARGYEGATISDYVAGRSHGSTVVITFDDGLRSVHEEARAILDEFGWPATVFVVSDRVGEDRPLEWMGEPEHPSWPRSPLDWDALGDLAEHGWEIGSHSRTHRLLSTLSAAERDDELRESRSRIAQRVGRCSSISYPFGEVVNDIVRAAAAAGYTAGTGLAGRGRRGDPMCIPRFAVGRGDGTVRFRLKTSSAFVAVCTSPAGDAIAALRGTAVSSSAVGDRG